MTRRVQRLDFDSLAESEPVLVLDDGVGSRRPGSGIGLDRRPLRVVRELRAGKME